MDLLSKEHLEGASKHDWKLFIKLAVAGALTAFGLYELGYNLELSFAAIVFIPAGGLFFTYIKHEADSNILRWVSIAVVAALFGLLIESWYLALAIFLMMEAATHSHSLERYEDTKWMRIVRAETSMDELNRLVSGHNLFRALPKEKRIELAERSTVMEVEDGAAFIKQGEFNYFLFLLAKGEAEVIRNGESMALLHAGDIFGEVSAAGLSLPVADVLARNSALAFAFPIDAITEAAESHQEFADHLRQQGMQIVTKHQQNDS